MRIEVMDNKTAKTLRRLAAFLVGRGHKGASRSDLLRRFNLAAEELDVLIEHLRQRKHFEAYTDDDTGGRPTARYRYLPDLSDFADEDKRCVWCAEVCPVSVHGSVVRYCSDECARAADGATGDNGGLRALMDRAQGHFKFDALIGYAATELISRGYTICTPMMSPSRDFHFVAVRDGRAATVIVYDIERLGNAEDLDTKSDAAVFIYPGGRILARGLSLRIAEPLAVVP